MNVKLISISPSRKDFQELINNTQFDKFDVYPTRIGSSGTLISLQRAHIVITWHSHGDMVSPHPDSFRIKIKLVNGQEPPEYTDDVRNLIIHLEKFVSDREDL